MPKYFWRIWWELFSFGLVLWVSVLIYFGICKRVTFFINERDGIRKLWLKFVTSDILAYPCRWRFPPFSKLWSPNNNLSDILPNNILDKLKIYRLFTTFFSVLKKRQNESTGFSVCNPCNGDETLRFLGWMWTWRILWWPGILVVGKWLPFSMSILTRVITVHLFAFFSL